MTNQVPDMVIDKMRLDLHTSGIASCEGMVGPVVFHAILVDLSLGDHPYSLKGKFVLAVPGYGAFMIDPNNLPNRFRLLSARFPETIVDVLVELVNRTLSTMPTAPALTYQPKTSD